MEEQRNRKLFINNLPEFLKLIELNEIFMKELEKHSYREYVEQVRKFEDEMARKTFIFVEFTRERSTCDQMVEILRKSGQEEAANQLQKYNTPSPFMDITYDIELKITPATVLRSGGSKMFVMDKNPRGMCIIINNMKKELHKESLRFKNIFEQLYFDVKESYNMSAKAMEDRLKELAKDKSLKNYNALVFMIISHGHDEQVIGFDGKDLNISTIVDIFSEDNCKLMKGKPKAFFFNCCRIQSEVPVIARQENKKIQSVGQKWINTNKFTFICFSCAQAERSWYVPKKFTFFGQAFSHVIAQYACEESLVSIMILTCDRLEKIVINYEEEKHSYLQISPEIQLCKVMRKLYFNPGLYRDNKSNKI